MKLFQIEEPEGGPIDLAAEGAAIGLDASAAEVEVAFSVGGNAVILNDRSGFEQALPVPAIAAEKTEWQTVFEAARARAERALTRPVTRAVIVLAEAPGAAATSGVHEAAESAGLQVLRLTTAAEFAPGVAPALAAAMLAEDLVPPPER